MSRFRKLSYAVWYCQYHVVWVIDHLLLEQLLGLAFQASLLERA